MRVNPFTPLVLSLFSRYSGVMPDDPAPQLRRADPDELRLTLSWALRRDGRRRFPHGSELMANLVADHLIQALEQSNYVVMQRPGRTRHSTSAGKPDNVG
jgi:hypothetical protein